MSTPIERMTTARLCGFETVSNKKRGAFDVHPLSAFQGRRQLSDKNAGEQLYRIPGGVLLTSFFEFRLRGPNIDTKLSQPCCRLSRQVQKGHQFFSRPEIVILDKFKAFGKGNSGVVVLSKRFSQHRARIRQSPNEVPQSNYETCSGHQRKRALLFSLGATFACRQQHCANQGTDGSDGPYPGSPIRLAKVISLADEYQVNRRTQYQQGAEDIGMIQPIMNSCHSEILTR